MKIKPWGNKIQLKIDDPSVGGMDISSLPTSIECGEIIAVGDGVAYNFIGNSKLVLKIGDKIFFKSWAVDIVSYNGTRYYFLDLDTKGLCGVIIK